MLPASVVGLPAKSGVYCMTSRATGRRYVGATCNIQRRAQIHRTKLRRGGATYPIRLNFKRASDCRFRVLELCKRSELPGREIFWIEKLQPELNVRVPTDSDFAVKM